MVGVGRLSTLKGTGGTRLPVVYRESRYPQIQPKAVVWGHLQLYRL